MKRTKLLIVMLISMLSVCLAFAACGSGETTPETKYALNKTELTLYVGDTDQLTVITTPNKDVTPTWSVAPAEVASVSDTGLVTALAQGTATITAEVDGKTLTCALTVSERPIEYEYTLNQTTATLEKGTTLQLSLACEPEQEGMEVTWESSNTAAVTVSASGLVTAEAAGNAAVNAKVGGGVVATCNITVFEYVYTFAKNLTIDYGDTTKTLSVTVAPVKPISISYTVDADGASVIAVSETGAISTLGVGTATVTVKDGETVLGTCTVKVQASVSSVEEKIQLHVDGTHKIVIESTPAADTLDISYEVVNGDTVAEVDDDGTITALANGEAKIQVTVDGREYFTDVTVSNVFGTASVQNLEKDQNNPIDITDGAEYWEQYIANGEINHKHYVTAEEDIIDRACEVDGTYLSDYPAFLSWSGGGNSDNCDCGKCAKDAHTTPDGGWNGNAGTKAYAVNQKGKVISLTIKVFAGESVIKVYTGGYNLTGLLTLKADDVTIAYATFDNKGAHNAQCVSFALDVKEATQVVVEVVMTDDNNNAPHSCISIAAVTVSGSVYQLENKSARILTSGTTDIVLNKDGTQLTTGVSYQVVEGTTVASVDNSGTVTGLSDGTATVKVTADGRVRYFTVNVGYYYTLATTKINLRPNETHTISLISDPVGATPGATYESSDTSVATVSTSGVITAVGNGAATVTVTVGSQELEITVNVSGLAVSERHEETADTIVDLTSSDIIYWEHYLYDELNPKALGTGERDLIDGSISGKSGDAGSTVKFYYTGSSGPKENSLVDGAWHKYSWGANYSFDITVPAGTHEIRVYTGVWETKNKTALYDGSVELASYTFERTSGGVNMLVAFSMTTSQEKVFTLKIDALSGNNCRLNAIAIVDLTVGKTTLNMTANNTIAEDSGKTVDLTASNIIDWATFGASNHEKAGADMIKTGTLSQGEGPGNANDFRANFDIGETDPVHSFKHNNEYVSVDVDVDSTVKTMSVYMSGWNADYCLVVTDSSGKVLSTVFVNMVSNGSVAKEIVFGVNATQADTLTVKVFKLSGSNCGIAAIALGGEAA